MSIGRTRAWPRSLPVTEKHFCLFLREFSSTFDNSVRDTIRRGAAENEVPKHEEKLTGAWVQISTLRRRYEKWCKGDDIEDCTSNDMRHRVNA